MPRRPALPDGFEIDTTCVGGRLGSLAPGPYLSVIDGKPVVLVVEGRDRVRRLNEVHAEHGLEEMVGQPLRGKRPGIGSPAREK